MIKHNDKNLLLPAEYEERYQTNKRSSNSINRTTNQSNVTTVKYEN